MYFNFSLMLLFLSLLSVVESWTGNLNTCLKNIQNKRNIGICIDCKTSECYGCATWLSSSFQCKCFIENVPSDKRVNVASKCDSNDATPRPSPQFDPLPRHHDDHLNDSFRRVEKAWYAMWYSILFMVLFGFCFCSVLTYAIYRQCCVKSINAPPVWTQPHNPAWTQPQMKVL